MYRKTEFRGLTTACLSWYDRRTALLSILVVCDRDDHLRDSARRPVLQAISHGDRPRRAVAGATNISAGIFLGSVGRCASRSACRRQATLLYRRNRRPGLS